MEEIKIYDLPETEKIYHDKSLETLLNLDKKYQITLASSDAMNIIHLSKYCIPVSDGNPNLSIDNPKLGIWVEFPHTTKVIDTSMKTYWIPGNTKVYIIGLYTLFYNGMTYDQSNAKIINAVYHYVPGNNKASIILMTDMQKDDMSNLINDIMLYKDYILMRDKHTDQVVPEYVHEIIMPKNKPVQPGKHSDINYIGPDIAKWWGLDKFNWTYVPKLYYQAGLFGWWNLLDIAKYNKCSKKQIFSQISEDVKNRSSHHKSTMSIRGAVLNKLTRDMGKDLYSNLTSKEKSVVESKYNTMNIMKPVDCESGFILINKLRYSIDNTTTSKTRLIDILSQVKAVFKKTATNGLMIYNNPVIKSKPQSTGILCPHLVDHASLLIKSDYIAKHVDHHNVRQYIIKRWGAEVPVNYNYFCNVCGEI
jgi:hypothetical protein